LAALPGATRFAAQGHASWIYQAKKVLPGNSLRVLCPAAPGAGDGQRQCL